MPDEIEQLIFGHAGEKANHDGVPVAAVHLHAAANDLIAALLTARDRLMHDLSMLAGRFAAMGEEAVDAVTGEEEAPVDEGATGDEPGEEGAGEPATEAGPAIEPDEPVEEATDAEGSGGGDPVEESAGEPAAEAGPAIEPEDPAANESGAGPEEGTAAA